MKIESKHIVIFSGLLLLALHVKASSARKSLPKVKYVDKVFGGYNARTIPPFGIYISKDQRNNKELLKHEIVHWNQFQKKGLLKYYMHYILGSIKGYDKNPMELEARFNETEFCKKNYSFCVRQGLSNTVHSKTFRKGR